MGSEIIKLQKKNNSDYLSKNNGVDGFDYFEKIFLCLIKYLSLTAIISGANSFAQVDVINELRKNPNIEVTLNAESSIEIYNKLQNHRYLKTIKQLPEYDNTTQANLIIELDTVNFAAYENLYKQWGFLDLENHRGKYISFDSNNDGAQEIYGTSWRQPDFVNAGEIHKRSIDSLFSFEFVYAETMHTFFDVGDITGDGNKDLICHGGYNWLIGYKQANQNSYLNTLNFIYSPFPSVFQPNDVTLYDIDGDGNLEMIYFLDAGTLDSVWAGSNHIAKYNPQINNFELVYYHRPQPEWYTNGISIGDFDQDGKGNFATGGIGGQFYIYEHVQGTTYQVEFTKPLDTYNAFLTIMTEDMDGNGKPEIWIAGDFASSVYGGVTRLFAFEATTPGVYEQVYQIDIRGLFSFIYGKLKYVDLDGDGQKELFLTNANLIFCFQYDNTENYYLDFIIQSPRLDSVYTTQRLEGIDIADLNGDGTVEIIPQYFLSKGWQESWEYRSVFLKRDKLTDLNEPEIILPNEFNLFQNYPNPFNPETKIKFIIPQETNPLPGGGRGGLVTLKVYDILGNEVATLVNATKPSGTYEVEFNGEGLSSGVYFYQLKVGGFQAVKKLVLMK